VDNGFFLAVVEPFAEPRRRGRIAALPPGTPTCAPAMALSFVSSAAAATDAAAAVPACCGSGRDSHLPGIADAAYGGFAVCDGDGQCYPGTPSGGRAGGADIAHVRAGYGGEDSNGDLGEGAGNGGLGNPRLRADGDWGEGSGGGTAGFGGVRGDGRKRGREEWREEGQGQEFSLGLEERGLSDGQVLEASREGVAEPIWAGAQEVATVEDMERILVNFLQVPLSFCPSTPLILSISLTLSCAIPLTRSLAVDLALQLSPALSRSAPAPLPTPSHALTLIQQFAFLNHEIGMPSALCYIIGAI
jgi:hypothetical protein